jgi:hypothetical protein
MRREASQASPGHRFLDHDDGQVADPSGQLLAEAGSAGDPGELHHEDGVGGPSAAERLAEGLERPERVLALEHAVDAGHRQEARCGGRNPKALARERHGLFQVYRRRHDVHPNR